MSFRDATLVEPLAVMLHVMEMTEIRLGDTVAVMGAGPIGLLMASVARLAGASRIFIIDRLPHRLQIARDMGVPDVTLDINTDPVPQAILDHTRGRGVDLVFDCAAAPQTFTLAMAVAAMGARLILIGIPAEAIPVDFTGAMFKELNIQTVKRSNHNTHAAIELMRSGRISDAPGHALFPPAGDAPRL